MMFTAVTVSQGYKNKDTCISSGYSPVYYHHDNTTYLYNSYRGNSVEGEYGFKRLAKNGGILDMYLDLKNYKLSYKTGGQDIGYCFDNLPQENYRMVVTLHNNQQQIELIAFDYN